jgi:hypothetical protein
MHPDLLLAHTRLYHPLGWACSTPQTEPESADYGAHALTVAGLRVRFRTAKITPTKVGQFVTLWQRVGTGPIQPFDAADPLDCAVVSVRRGAQLGQFVFPMAVLRQQGVVSVNGLGGKRALRVYPPWDTPTSRQAEKTQQWQRECFVDLSDGAIDLARARQLYGL